MQKRDYDLLFAEIFVPVKVRC
ncbi:hypothetical protein [Sicyoidochytrium minutum DNA virus]|nr:hypothetical protein [Sicyoidochytrium minutum DNA virus]